MGEPVVLDGGEIDCGERLQNLLRARALHGDERIAIARVHGRDVGHGLLGARGNPCVVLVDVGGVDHEQVVRRTEAIDQQVVDERPLGRGQRRVLNLPDLQLAGIVAGDVLDRGQRVFAGNLDLAHVRHVEQARRGAHGQVFGRDARILDRHVPAAKRNHAGAKRHVRVVQRGFLERDGAGVSHEGAGVSAAESRDRRASERYYAPLPRVN